MGRHLLAFGEFQFEPEWLADPADYLRQRPPPGNHTANALIFDLHTMLIIRYDVTTTLHVVEAILTGTKTYYLGGVLFLESKCL